MTVTEDHSSKVAFDWRVVSLASCFQALSFYAWKYLLFHSISRKLSWSSRVPGSQGRSEQPAGYFQINRGARYLGGCSYLLLTLASLAWTLAVKVLPLSTRLGIQRKAKHGAFTRKKCKHFAGIEPKIAGWGELVGAKLRQNTTVKSLVRSALGPLWYREINRTPNVSQIRTMQYLEQR